MQRTSERKRTHESLSDKSPVTPASTDSVYAVDGAGERAQGVLASVASAVRCTPCDREARGWARGERKGQARGPAGAGRATRVHRVGWSARPVSRGRFA
jgi:hypothetical protein